MAGALKREVALLSPVLERAACSVSLVEDGEVLLKFFNMSGKFCLRVLYPDVSAYPRTPALICTQEDEPCSALHGEQLRALSNAAYEEPSSLSKVLEKVWSCLAGVARCRCQCWLPPCQCSSLRI